MALKILAQFTVRRGTCCTGKAHVGMYPAQLPEIDSRHAVRKD